MKKEDKNGCKIAFVLHGTSLLDQEEKFVGWTNSDLGHEGIMQAKGIGEALKQEGYEFDVCFTSTLKRTVQAWNIIADILDHNHIPVIKHWRLNGKHLGAYEGKKKEDVIREYGEKKIESLFKEYNAQPPPQSALLAVPPKLYRKTMPMMIPLGESQKLVTERAVVYFLDTIVGYLQKKKRVIVVGHDASIRALIGHIRGLTEKEILDLQMKPDVALIYELDEKLKINNARTVTAKPIEIEGNKDKTAASGIYENTRDAFWSKELREMRIYSAEQIIVPEPAPLILKNYCKEVIRANPGDIIKFSKEYFEKLLKEQEKAK